MSNWTRMSARYCVKVVCVLLTVSWLVQAQRLTAQHTVAATPDARDRTHEVEAMLGRPVTIVLDRVSLRQAVDSIARIADVPLQYRAPLIAAYTTPVSVNVKKVALGVVLEQVLDGTKLHVTSDGEGHLLIEAVTTATGDSTQAVGVIIGRVIDSTTRRGLAGATIKIVGSKLVTVTKDSGQFSVPNVPVGAQVLSVKLFGYRAVERSVTVIDSGHTSVRVVMVGVPNTLTGVVTTATGFQRKVEIGNDITTLNVDSVMRVAPISSLTDLLETRVPGLTVLHSSGVPGDPSRIRLRGASSITGSNDPIVIVDGVRVYASQSDSRNVNLAPSLSGGVNKHYGGSTTGVALSGTATANTYAVPSPLDQIDPNSIATIEVFKGPSASALYGSDAANGVIVITTKRGNPGPTQWRVELGQGVNWLPGTWPANDYRFGYNVITPTAITSTGFCKWYDPNCKIDSLVAFQALNDPRYTVFSHGSDQTASLTISGGVPALLYSTTGSLQQTVGNLKLPTVVQQQYDSAYGPIPHYLVRPDNLQSWGVNGSLTARPSTTLHVELQSALFDENQQRSSLEDAISQIDGEYINATNLVGIPLVDNAFERATSRQLSSTNGMNADWTALSWLQLTTTGGLNIIQRNDETYIPYGVNSVSVYGVNINGGGGGEDTTGSYGLGRGMTQVNTLNIVGTVLSIPRVKIAVGMNYQSEKSSDFSAYTNQLSPGVSEPTAFPTTPVNGASPSTFGQATSALSTYGLYIQPQIHVLGSFYLNPALRTDGGSTSGDRSGLIPFPKIDLSYLVVDPDRPRGWLTLLRPRLAFGYAGTQPGPTEKLRLFNSNGSQVVTLDDSTFVSIVQLTSLGNSQLRPERSRELEGGFEAELWQNRLSLSYSQYNKTLSDAIISIPVPPSVTGVEGLTIAKNIGIVRNTGIEITANAIVFESRELNWNIAANLSNNNNVVVRLNPGQGPIEFDNGARVVAGYPLFGIWSYPLASFADANHDGVIESNEIRVADSSVYVGQPEPKYQLNLSTGVVVFNGQLSLNATFAYQNGFTQNNQGACNSRAFDLIPNAPNTPLSTQAASIAARCDGSGGAPTQFGLFQTVSTFRFNDLSVNYNVPQTFSNQFRLPRMRVALQGSNLGLHTNYRGKDPAVNAISTVSGGDANLDLGQVPQPRTWWLKLSMGN